MILEKNIGSCAINSKIWPRKSGDVDDLPALKIVIMREDDTKTFENIVENNGSVPRIYRNAVLFLCPSESEKGQFFESLKSKIALKIILEEHTTMKPEQQKDVEKELKCEEVALNHLIRKYYRTLYIPNKNGLARHDMGIPIVGESRGITTRVFNALKSQQQVHESIGSLVIQDEHLAGQNHTKTFPIYELMLKLRGSRRPINRDVVKKAIESGIAKKVFGLGSLVDGNVQCKNFGGDSNVEFSDNEVIIEASICEGQMQKLYGKNDSGKPVNKILGGPASQDKIKPVHRKSFEVEFNLPDGKMSDLLNTLRLLNTKCRSMHFTIKSDDTDMTNDDVDKVSEGLDQIGAQHIIK